MATEIKPQQRQVLLYPGEDGYFVVEVPSLPGCISQGKTRDEALVNIEEAITLYTHVRSQQYLQQRSLPTKSTNYNL